ncbi:MAG: bifunctional biotin--[acetyl-CoA-carboxylase] ligase/biotin operon repressor BirA [Gammaproteobacteria bacterium]|nr:bifunctional biotin--[acetyl-CoA-carboxylase] ligase/biotin operon repressor BirA [Gammaproteobacteria bacterium]
MSNRMRLLQLMAAGACHSGETLGSQLGISRSAIWKQLKALEALGLEFDAVPGKGYRLTQPIELLDRAAIIAAIPAQLSTHLNAVEVHDEIDSTNSYLMQRAQNGAASGTVCLAEYQRSGRGRRGRQWISPFGSSIYLSLLWRFPVGPEQLGGLSLAAAVAVTRALHDVGARNIGLKWPNDVICEQRKLAGILLELNGEASGASNVVIGIGINVNMPPTASGEIDQPWTDLTSICSNPVSRNQLTGLLIGHLLETLTTYQQQGLTPFINAWCQADILADQRVELHMHDKTITGTARGIDNDGALLLDCAGKLQRHQCGEVSLRRATPIR